MRARLPEEDIVADDAGIRALLSCGTIVALTGAMMRNGGPAVEDFFVWYEDGYTSWSPWEAFEGGYTRTRGASCPDEPPSLTAIPSEYVRVCRGIRCDRYLDLQAGRVCCGETEFVALGAFILCPAKS